MPGPWAGRRHRDRSDHGAERWPPAGRGRVSPRTAFPAWSRFRPTAAHGGTHLVAGLNLLAVPAVRLEVAAHELAHPGRFPDGASRVVLGGVRLDVKDRRSVDGVKAAHCQLKSVDGEQRNGKR